MKQSEQIQINSEHQLHRQTIFSHHNSHNNTQDVSSFQIPYDEDLLRNQIKLKYKEHLKSINNSNAQKNSFKYLFKCFITFMFAIFEQLWIQLIPQFMRGRHFGEKASSFMDKYQKLNCGNMAYFLDKMKNQGRNFFIILEEKPSEDQCFQIQQKLFDSSEESDHKLSFILTEYQTISLTSENMKQLLESESNFSVISSLSGKYAKFPVLLVCRFNFLQQLCLVASIETASLTQDHFRELLDSIKGYISQLKNIEGECKRQALTQILHAHS